MIPCFALYATVEFSTERNAFPDASITSHIRLLLLNHWQNEEQLRSQSHCICNLPLRCHNTIRCCCQHHWNTPRPSIIKNGAACLSSGVPFRTIKGTRFLGGEVWQSSVFSGRSGWFGSVEFDVKFLLPVQIDQVHWRNCTVRCMSLERIEDKVFHVVRSVSKIM